MRRRPTIALLFTLAACGAVAEEQATTAGSDAGSDGSSSDASSPTGIDATATSDGSSLTHDTGTSPMDGGQQPDASVDAAVTDASGDSATTTTKITSWTSPNGATWEFVDGGDDGGGGVRFTGFPTFNHGIIVPDPPLVIPSDNYTVHGTILIKNPAEVGLITRGQTDGGGVELFGTQFGGENKTFLGIMGPPDYNPTGDNIGPLYTLSAGTRYELTLRAAFGTVYGKIWEATQPEPAMHVIATSTPYLTGGIVGFYSYSASDAVFENLYVTVP